VEIAVAILLQQAVKQLSDRIRRQLTQRQEKFHFALPASGPQARQAEARIVPDDVRGSYIGHHAADSRQPAFLEAVGLEYGGGGS